LLNPAPKSGPMGTPDSVEVKVSVNVYVPAVGRLMSFEPVLEI